MIYICKFCGCKEFISNPNRYDIFEAKEDKLCFIDSEYVEDDLILFCRDCSELLVFNEDDLEF